MGFYCSGIRRLLIGDLYGLGFRVVWLWKNLIPQKLDRGSIPKTSCIGCSYRFEGFCLAAEVAEASLGLGDQGVGCKVYLKGQGT